MNTHDRALLAALTAAAHARGGSVLRSGNRAIAIPPFSGVAVWVALKGEDSVYGFGYHVRDLLPLSDGYPTEYAIDLLTAIMDGHADETFAADGRPLGFRVTGTHHAAASLIDEPGSVTVAVPAWSTS